MSQDDAFDILSNGRRRFVLYYLREAGEPVELGELAGELAAWENETTPSELTKQQRKRVYVSLYQTHIQKLADANVIEYDQDTGMVRLADGSGQIGEYLSVGTEEGGRTRWQEAYVALAAAGAVLYALVALEVSFFAVFSELQVGVVIVGALALLASAHYVHGRRQSAEIPADALIRDDRGPERDDR